MPTSKEETLYISKILEDNLQFVENRYFIQKRLTQDLAEKVGYLTINYSVRKSLFDLCRHYNPEWKIKEDIINKLIDEWFESTQSVELSEFVGMDENDWKLYCEEKYQCF